MTDDQYQELLKLMNNCAWKQLCDGAAVCRGAQLPCEVAIDKGLCEVCKEYFMKLKGEM